MFATTDGTAASRLQHGVCVRQGVPDDVDETCPWSVGYEGSVLFLGELYEERAAFGLALQDLFGARFCHARNVRCGDLTRLVREHKVIVAPNWPRVSDYWSNRIYVVTGHGGLFVGPTIEGMAREGWVPGVNYLALSDDVMDVARIVADMHTVAVPDGYEAVRRAGYAHARAHCTYDARVADLVRHIEATR